MNVLQILTETIQKEDVTLDKLHDLTFYRHFDHASAHTEEEKISFPNYHLNPFNKKNHQFVSGKLLNRDPPQGTEQANPDYLINVHRRSKLPYDRNIEKFESSFPETSSQEFGWFTKFVPTIPVDRRIDHSKRLTDISRYMDTLWGYYPPPEAKFHPRNK